ncbi:unnamed protein product [Closterium sp. NIES-53]
MSMTYDELVSARSKFEELISNILLTKQKQIKALESDEGNETAKNETASAALADIQEFSTEASVILLDLRRLNRQILNDEERVKSETEAARAPVDTTALRLHNIQYKMNHHARSIAAYRDFVSRHPDIELVSAHDFFMDAPESLKSEPGLEKDPHRLMLQRLNYELHQRKELVRAREMLEIRRRTLQESISSRKKFLGSLPGQLKALKKASGPLQQQMGMQHSRRVKQHRLASLLPPPLYVLER